MTGRKTDDSSEMKVVVVYWEFSSVRIYLKVPDLYVTLSLIKCSMCFFLLETVQRTRWCNAGHAGSIHSAELDFRDVESDGGGLQPGLHHFQRTGQNGSNCPPTSRRKRVISQGRTIRGMTTKSGGRGKKEIRGEKRLAVSLLQNSHFGWRHCSQHFIFMSRGG